MTVREADARDWPAVAEFFLSAPLESGVAFVLDRRPDFTALLRLRGAFRTFLALDGCRLAGTVTALWRAARCGDLPCTVGELVDFRVASWARGGRAAYVLLRAAHRAFEEHQVDWLTCLIGDRNQATVSLVAQRAGLPALLPLSTFYSLHFVAWRVPEWSTQTCSVREATANDAPAVTALWSRTLAGETLAPIDGGTWPQEGSDERAWIASGPDGELVGLLVSCDVGAARRIRVMRYRAIDFPVRGLAWGASCLGIANSLPPPGAPLDMWATRAVIVPTHKAHIVRALVRAALRDAAAAGKHVLQVNMAADDALLGQMPRYPRSTYRSTLYGCALRGEGMPPFQGPYHADIARV